MATPSDPRLLAGCRHFARAAGFTVAAIGALVLAGWALDVQALRSVLPSLTAMNPGGTAVAFLLTGASLSALAGPPGRLRAAGRACAALVLALALVRLAGYLADWDGGPDQLLFLARLDREEVRLGYANRMAPNTAAAFAALALALLLLDVRGRRGPWPAQL